jgi:hypothetical protein
LTAVLLTLGIGLFLTGALVGAIHGLALVWLAQQGRLEPRAAY